MRFSVRGSDSGNSVFLILRVKARASSCTLDHHARALALLKPVVHCSLLLLRKFATAPTTKHELFLLPGNLTLHVHFVVLQFCVDVRSCERRRTGLSVLLFAAAIFGLGLRLALVALQTRSCSLALARTQSVVGHHHTITIVMFMMVVVMSVPVSASMRAITALHPAATPADRVLLRPIDDRTVRQKADAQRRHQEVAVHLLELVREVLVHANQVIVIRVMYQLIFLFITVQFTFIQVP